MFKTFSFPTYFYSFAFLLCSFTVNGQFAIGLSANLGNRVSYEPSSNGFKRAPALSGNLILTVHEPLKNGWSIDSGIDLGVLGHTIKVVTLDTLLNGVISSFPDYATFYGNLSLMVSKSIGLFNRELSLGIGGGATMYYPLIPTTYGIGIAGAPGQPSRDVFSANTDPPNMDFSGFIKTGVQSNVSSSIILGINYLHHFKPAYTGTFEFYHTEEPVSGTFSVYQREIKVFIMYLFNKKITAANKP